ncbi:MAG: hypothetical protein Q4G21_06670 [Dermabacter sp.]|nr:hypothetical protein [Dermabacter sp.]
MRDGARPGRGERLPWWASLVCALLIAPHALVALWKLLLWALPGPSLALLERWPWLYGFPAWDQELTPPQTFWFGLVYVGLLAAALAWIAWTTRRRAGGEAAALARPLIGRGWRSLGWVLPVGLLIHWSAIAWGASLVTRFTPVVNEAERLGLAQPTWSASSDAYATATSATDTWFSAIGVGLIGASEELAFVALLALWLRTYRVSWGWVIAASLLLRIGIHAEQGWYAVPKSVFFGLSALLLVMLFHSISGAFLAHLLWNASLTLTASSWIETPGWALALRGWGSPLMELAGGACLIAVGLLAVRARAQTGAPPQSDSSPGSDSSPAAISA